MARPVRLAALVLLAAPTAQPSAAQDYPPIAVPPPLAMGVGEGSFGYGGVPPGVDLSAPPDFTGVLDDQDPVRPGGYPYEAHTFRADAGDEVAVTMTAADFDTYLIVRSPTGQEWTNDDFGDTRTSHVAFSAGVGGTYTVWASAFSTEGRGAYEVRVSTAAATVLSTVDGRLDYQDAQQIKGEFFDTLEIRPPSSGEFYVELLPLGFYGFVRVTSPSGVRQSASQQFDGTPSARVGPLQGERGTWTVEVTTGSAGEVGAYDLRVITLNEE